MKREYVPYDRDPAYTLLREERRREEEARRGGFTFVPRDFFWETLLALPFEDVGTFVTGRAGDFLDGATVLVLRDRVPPRHHVDFGYVGNRWNLRGLLAWELALAMLPGSGMDARRGTVSSETRAALRMTLEACDLGGGPHIRALMLFLQMKDPAWTPKLWREAFDFSIGVLP